MPLKMFKDVTVREAERLIDHPAGGPEFRTLLTWLEGRGRQRAQRRGDLQQHDGRDLRYERGIGGSIEEDMWGVFFISAQDEATDTDRVIP